MVKRFFTNPGSPKRVVLRLSYDRLKGYEDVVPVGYEDWQGYIDAAAASCDINAIITRIRNGEVDLLKAKPGMYGDFREVPGTMAEVLQKSIDGQAIFDGLPKDLKKNFSSFGEFAASAGSKDWFEKLGFKEESEVKPVADSE